jgi:hypothetical protein
VLAMLQEDTMVIIMLGNSGHGVACMKGHGVVLVMLDSSGHGGACDKRAWVHRWWCLSC